jgi:hypothetical protein
MMQYNVCQICGAKDGRAGLLIGGPNKPHACRNCHDTREYGEIVIHANLVRTQEEIEKTFAILNNKMSNINNELVLYVVRNAKGQYFRAKGFSRSGNTWVDDINKAKIYGKIGGARGTVTYFAQNPKFPVPEIVKLTVTGMEVIDESARVKKVLDKKAKEEQEREARNAKYQLEQAKARLASAEAELNRLQKNK